MTAVDALYAEILTKPEDNTLRLVYADALDERAEGDDCDRAAFIRVQMDIQRYKDRQDEHNERRKTHEFMLPYGGNCECQRLLRQDRPCPYCVAIDTEDRLLTKNKHRRRHKCPTCSGTGTQPGSTGQLCCRTCIVAGDLLASTGTANPDDFDIRGDTLIAESRRIEFRRGFVDTVSCIMEEVVRGGVISEWAKAIVRAFPISEFVVTDRVPFVWLDRTIDFISDRTILRYRGMTPGWARETNYERSTIPVCVADLMDGPYKTHQEATAAFRKTLVNLVRSQA